LLHQVCLGWPILDAWFHRAAGWGIVRGSERPLSARSGNPGPAGSHQAIEAEERELEQMRMEGEQEEMAAE
jgi:hypothetical protein